MADTATERPLCNDRCYGEPCVHRTTFEYAVVYREDGRVSTYQVTQQDLPEFKRTARVHGEILAVIRMRPDDYVRHY